jgi:hypothetical protein
VTLDISEHTVRPGDRVRAVVDVRPIAMVEGTDLYLGVRLPNGHRFVRRAAGLMTSPTRHGLSSADRSAVIGAAGHATTIPLIDIEIGPGIVGGTYEVFAVVAKPAHPTQLDVELGDVLAWAVETVLVDHP